MDLLLLLIKNLSSSISVAIRPISSVLTQFKFAGFFACSAFLTCIRLIKTLRCKSYTLSTVFEEDVDGSAARPRAQLPLGPFNFPRSRPFGSDRLTVGG